MHPLGWDVWRPRMGGEAVIIEARIYPVWTTPLFGLDRNPLGPNIASFIRPGRYLCPVTRSITFGMSRAHQKEYLFSSMAFFRIVEAVGCTTITSQIVGYSGLI
jgi:hypothetical protein